MLTYIYILCSCSKYEIVNLGDGEWGDNTMKLRLSRCEDVKREADQRLTKNDMCIVLYQISSYQIYHIF